MNVNILYLTNFHNVYTNITAEYTNENLMNTYQGNKTIAI